MTHLIYYIDVSQVNISYMQRHCCDEPVSKEPNWLPTSQIPWNIIYSAVVWYRDFVTSFSQHNILSRMGMMIGTRPSVPMMSEVIYPMPAVPLSKCID